MPEYGLAQLNVARMVAPLDSPTMVDFVANLERINALAEQSPGYVWRLQTDEGDASSLRPFGEDMIVNLTVWKNIESLHHYVYKTAHAEIMSRRKEWFERMREVYAVLWWVPQGHIPTLHEAGRKLALLEKAGPGPEAFTFKKPWPPENYSGKRPDSGFDAVCPAM